MDPHKEAQTESTILTGKRLWTIFVALLFTVLLIALDQTILATALPRIASDLNGFTLQAWVAASFILAQSAFLLVFGQVLRIFAAKWILLATITIFELGSLVCGLAHNMGALIAGRTVSGLGAAGMFVSILQILAQATRLEDRPKFMGMLGVVYSVASIIGPLIGGALTDHVSWRWCFYLNLPVGGVSMAAISMLLKPDLWDQVRKIDFVAAVLAAGSVTCLGLALQWGGNTKSWNDKAVIVTFVFAGILAVALVFWEKHVGDAAMAPLVIFKSRSIYAVMLYGFLTRFTQLIFAYASRPVFPGFVEKLTATKSGIDILPMLVSGIVLMIASGALTSKFGYYYPWLLAAPVFLVVGSGLFYSITLTTSSAKLAGFQVILGASTGLGLQNSLVAVQVEFKDEPKLLAQSQSVASFFQFLGGMVGLSVAEAVFASELTRFLARYAPDAPAAVVRNSPTAIYTDLPAALIPGVVKAYLRSLRVVYLIGVPIAGVSILAALFIKNIKIVKEGPASAKEESAPAKEADVKT
ncbi:Major facilitator transporter-like protein [Mycena sanguinolenta]|uniref:Major facilitator transporter-like protein n=1 Tax=Mycena sanguinolenta TaxID=230812 RepID=A0A8H6ZFM9_9AGAR|nr:Major facilitator transporter-like protein [Mycena sanguinolenta]